MSDTEALKPASRWTRIRRSSNSFVHRSGPSRSLLVSQPAKARPYGGDSKLGELAQHLVDGFALALICLTDAFKQDGVDGLSKPSVV